VTDEEIAALADAEMVMQLLGELKAERETVRALTVLLQGALDAYVAVVRYQFQDETWPQERHHTVGANLVRDGRAALARVAGDGA
jgi:hypothetical protein